MNFVSIVRSVDRGIVHTRAIRDRVQLPWQPCYNQFSDITSNKTAVRVIFWIQVDIMSQHWHGHWTNEAFMPMRLRNWEVPRWYPSQPDQHCAITRFIADDRGHILKEQNKSNQSPWGNFKHTWELPLKISRKKAIELSSPPQHKIRAWKLHKSINNAICKGQRVRAVEKVNGRIAADPAGVNLPAKSAEIDVSQGSESCVEKPCDGFFNKTTLLDDVR